MFNVPGLRNVQEFVKHGGALPSTVGQQVHRLSLVESHVELGRPLQLRGADPRARLCGVDARVPEHRAPPRGRGAAPGSTIATPCRRSCGFSIGYLMIRPYVLQSRQMFLPVIGRRTLPPRRRPRLSSSAVYHTRVKRRRRKPSRLAEPNPAPARAGVTFANVVLQARPAGLQ